MKNLIKIVLIFIVVLMLAGTAFSQKAGVIASAHNVGGNGCQSCHAPHNGSKGLSPGTDQATGKVLLWDRAFSSQTFGTYDSPTMDNKATEIGGGSLVNTEARMYSLLCMSCHDGVTTTGVISATSEFAVGNPTNSFGLQNDHPVNMPYDITKDTGLAAIASVTSAGLKLYGATNTVQCASCHNVHSPTFDPFLRKSNASSALCTTCHS